MKADTPSRVFKKIRSRTNRKNQKNDEAKSTIDYSGPFSKEDLWAAQPRFREVTKRCVPNICVISVFFFQVSPENRPFLFIKHLRMCSILFDFNTENSKENLGKEMKRQLLLVILVPDSFIITPFTFLGHCRSYHDLQAMVFRVSL